MLAEDFPDDPLLQLVATIKFKKFLSSLKYLTSPTVDKEIQSGVVTRLVEFLEKEDSPNLQFAAAWALTNIAADKPEVVIEHGAVPILVKLLSSPNDDVLEQAIWALGNIGGSTVERRDYVLSCEVLLPLLPHLNMNTYLPIIRIATWTLINLCRGQPPPLFEVKPVLAALEKILPIYDEMVLRNACWAFWYLSKGSEEGFRSLIEAGLVPKIVNILHRAVFFCRHASSVVILPAICIIANIVSEDNHQTQCVVNSGALHCFATMLSQDYEEYDKSIKSHTCWTISNITASTEEQIQAVIDANLIPSLVKLAKNAEFEIKKEALWAISNVTSCGSQNQIMYLVGKNCIKPFCDNLLMACPDPRIISKCLNGLANILKVGEAKKNRGSLNYYCHLIDEEGGHDKIEILQSHDNKEIWKKAMKILETYWP